MFQELFQVVKKARWYSCSRTIIPTVFTGKKQGKNRQDDDKCYEENRS